MDTVDGPKALHPPLDPVKDALIPTATAALAFSIPAQPIATAPVMLDPATSTSRLTPEAENDGNNLTMRQLDADQSPDLNVLADGLGINMDTPARPCSPFSSSSSTPSISASSSSSTLADDYGDNDAFRTPPPMPAPTEPPSPPRPGRRGGSESAFQSGRERVNKTLENGYFTRLIFTRSDKRTLARDQQQPLPQHHDFTFSAASTSCLNDDEAPRRSLTSIAGSSRCLWPPDSTYLTMSSTFKERAVQHRRITPEAGSDTLIFTLPSPSGHTLSSASVSGSTSASTGSASMGVSSLAPFAFTSQKSHDFYDTNDCMQELQPLRKARRVMEGPYFKEKNYRMVAGHVRKLIQEAVEDGLGELDLSNLELTDLPSEIRDLNYGIVYNERGSFSLSKNSLKLFLSSNQFAQIPMDVFALDNLSVLSIRNNKIESIPPEIGHLHNLVELSVGGNLLKVLPAQIALMPKLNIITVHPNPFMTPPEPEPEPELGQEAQDHNIIEAAVIISDNDANTVAEQPPIPIETQQNIVSVTFVSPPTSPDITLAYAQSADMDVEMSIPDLEGFGLGSCSSTAAIVADIEIQNPPSGESSSLTTASVPVSLATGAASHVVNPSVALQYVRRELPLHQVTRSHIPSLLILAGNAILNYVESQDAATIPTATNRIRPSTPTFLKDPLERPRKDSKISMDGDEWVDEQGNTFGKAQLPLEAGPSTGSQDVLMVTTGPSKPGRGKKQYVFKDETIKSYMTPYLYDVFKRARKNNRCAGCQKLFWKSCRVVVVWQEILGQPMVPIQWKGCGMGGCPGVPPSLWYQRLPSPEVEPSIAHGAVSTAAAASMTNTQPILS
ncbi:hypothetical protein BGZ98_002605 [Dissophora globulifera]|nr:hypothetical protein BGZ98_002605 [Dissophora globulifera]